MLSRKKRKAIFDVHIESYAAEGKSIAHLDDGKVLFVSNAIPGDVIDVWVTKEKKQWAEGKLVQLKQPSPHRIDAFCPHFGTCGGCKWQMLPYEKQLEFKQQQVWDQLSRIGHIELPIPAKILGSPRQQYYRNKLEFTFSAQRYFTNEELRTYAGHQLPEEHALGFHAPGLFDKVVPIYTCYLQQEPTEKLLRVLRQYTEAKKLSYYHFRQQKGWLRNVIIRISTTGEVLINLVVREYKKDELEIILDHLWQEIPETTSLHYTINPKVNDSLHDLEVHTYKGKGYIEEQLEDFVFKISPKSFFQTNSYQAVHLYRKVREFARLTGNEVVYDLYCGTGSIGIFCARNASKIIGIEVVPEAIEDAKENARINGLDHCHFYAGDVASVCTDDFFAQNGKPDVILTDPPRAGMHEQLIQQILSLKAPRVVYVSCNPATQARDLQLLDAAYKVVSIQPVDMFPHTHHIENIVLLELK